MAIHRRPACLRNREKVKELGAYPITFHRAHQTNAVDENNQSSDFSPLSTSVHTLIEIEPPNEEISSLFDISSPIVNSSLL